MTDPLPRARILDDARTSRHKAATLLITLVSARDRRDALMPRLTDAAADATALNRAIQSTRRLVISLDRMIGDAEEDLSNDAMSALDDVCIRIRRAGIRAM